MVSSKNSTPVDYTKLFPKNHVWRVCKYQVLLSSFAILIEIVWIIFWYGPTEKNIVQFWDTYVTGVGIWCGVFGVVSATFGLWICRNPSRQKIVVFLVLNVINGLSYMGFITLVMAKMNLFYHAEEEDHHIMMTMIVIYLIIGALQEVLILISIIYVIICDVIATSFFRPTTNENGRDFQLVPSNFDTENPALD